MALFGFMKFSRIEGVSADENHKDWFHVDSFSFGINHEFKSQLQNTDHHAQFSAITVTRSMDDASSQIIEAVDKGSVGDCSLSFAKSVLGDSHPLVTLNLSNAQITSYNTEISKEGSMMEHLTIHFMSFHYEYSPVSLDKKQMPACSYKCDVEQY